MGGGVAMGGGAGGARRGVGGVRRGAGGAGAEMVGVGGAEEQSGTEASRGVPAPVQGSSSHLA